MSVRSPRAIFVAAIVAIATLGALAAVQDGTQVRTSSSAADVTHTQAPDPVTTTTPEPQGTTVTPPSTNTPSTTAMPAPTDSRSFASAASATSTTISGTEKVWVSVVSVTPQTSDDVNTGLTQAATQTVVSQLNSYWSAQSNGAVTIQFAGFETRALGQNTCDPNSALSAEESAAFGGRFAHDAWKGTHEHLLVLSAESCSADSFATVGGTGGEIFSGNGIGAAMGVPYLLHEFGHNLGFEHADASICTNTSSYDGRDADFSFTSTVCPTREYDDYLDIMGYTVGNATPGLSSPQRILAGWLPNYAHLTASATVTLTALSGSGGTQALQVVDPSSGDTYYVEYRTDSGLDATSAEFNYGLQCDPAMSGYTICELDGNKAAGEVRVLRVLPFASAGANGTTVLASALTAGSTDKTKRHTHFDRGDSFTSVDGAFSIRVVSVSPSSGAVIAVTFASAASGSGPTPRPTPTFTTVPATLQQP